MFLPFEGQELSLFPKTDSRPEGRIERERERQRETERERLHRKIFGTDSNDGRELIAEDGVNNLESDWKVK
jgi:hypothetical protein